MNNEFEEMRQQMNILKEKLQQQDIVNEKVMRRTMKRNVSGINRRYTFVSILCILMIPYSYWAFVSLTGMSIYFWAATSVFMLLCFGYTVYNGRHLNSRSGQRQETRPRLAENRHPHLYPLARIPGL